MTYVIPFVLLAFCVMSSAAAEGGAVTSKAEAAETASQYTGLMISKSLADAMTRTTVMHDDNIPFLSDSIEGKRAWVVTFRNVILQRGADERAKSQPQAVMDFEIYLDKETGKLFKIVSPYVGGDSLWKPLPSGKVLTSWIWGNETYHGFPDIPPKVPFMDAYLSAAGCSPFAAEEVIAHYVLHSRETDSAPRPVWCITTRGVPYPIILGDSRNREDERTSLRCVVDATSGQWLFVENYR